MVELMQAGALKKWRGLFVFCLLFLSLLHAQWVYALLASTKGWNIYTYRYIDTSIIHTRNLLSIGPSTVPLQPIPLGCIFVESILRRCRITINTSFYSWYILKQFITQYFPDWLSSIILSVVCWRHLNQTSTLVFIIVCSFCRM